MRKVTDAELKQIQIRILDAVVEFCNNNNIQYWLDSGTLLGAIRHKGYIPWDDDIDIGMLRKDFDTFMQTFNITNDRYKAFCIDNNPDFYYAHGKVLDTSTVLFEPDENGTKLSINIDIFVYDIVPNNEKILKQMYDRRDMLRVLHTNRNFNYKPRGNAIRRFCIYIFRLLLKCFPKNYFIKKISINSKKFAHTNNEYVGNFTAFTRMICHKRVFDDYIDVQFEGKKYRAPVGYDEWLKSFYGNYMELPPIDKRVSHHTFVAYVD